MYREIRNANKCLKWEREQKKSRGDLEKSKGCHGWNMRSWHFSLKERRLSKHKFFCGATIVTLWLMYWVPSGSFDSEWDVKYSHHILLYNTQLVFLLLSFTHSFYHPQLIDYPKLFIFGLIVHTIPSVHRYLTIIKIYIWYFFNFFFVSASCRLSSLQIAHCF